MRRLVWARRARSDLESIERYWLDERPDYVAKVMAATRHAIALLLETPGAGSPVGSPDLRRWRLGKTPYLMLYRVSRTELRVLRIHHERQNWRRTT